MLLILTTLRVLALGESFLVMMSGQSRFPPPTLHSQSETSIFQLPGTLISSSSMRCPMVLPVTMSLRARTREPMLAMTSVAVLFQSSSRFLKRASLVIVISRSIQSTLTALLGPSHQFLSLNPLTLTLTITLSLVRARLFLCLLSIGPHPCRRFLRLAALSSIGRLPRSGLPRRSPSPNAHQP